MDLEFSYTGDTSLDFSDTITLYVDDYQGYISKAYMDGSGVPVSSGKLEYTYDSGFSVMTDSNLYGFSEVTFSISVTISDQGSDYSLTPVILLLKYN